VIEIHTVIIIIDMLINLGEGIFVPNRRPMLIYSNFSLFFSFSYINRVAIITVNLINYISLVA